LPSKADALGKAYARAFEFELKSILDKHPKYVWGGSESEEKGLDCSGYLYLAARRAGMPVRRTTALRMSQADGGWHSRIISKTHTKLLDLLWWTWKEGKRPNGHVGVKWKDNHILQSASSRGVVEDELKGRLVDKMTLARRLEIGD